jgi:RHS repeat-associated protein
MSISNNLNSSRSQVFAYDPLNRLISAGTTATSGNYCWGYVYTYDAWGNLTAQAASSGYSGCTEYLGPGSTATGNNQLSGFAYDPSGNTLSDGVYSYTWDGESQIKTAAGVTYSYDGDGRRVSKSTGKLYWYGSGGEILAETDGSGNTQNEYIFFGGKRVAMLPAGSSPLYYVGDMLGSSRVITTSTGVVCYDADFYPYGGEAAYTNSCAQSYKFEGKERDSETQNDEFGARSYSWRFGRWLSADWSNVPAPVPYANLTNPQTLNLYAMVADDPESFADLDGHYFNTGLSQSESAHSQDACAQGILSACNADQSTAMIREAEAQAAQAQNQAQSQNPAQQQHSISGFFSRIFHRHHVRFEGNSVERSILKDNWNKLMQSNNARALAKIALKKGDLTIRTTDGDSFSRKSDNSINVNIFSNPPVTTTEGVENYTLTYIVMGHELGHRAGYNDDGPNRMNNINHSENPIRRDFGLPERTEY